MIEIHAEDSSQPRSQSVSSDSDGGFSVGSFRIAKDATTRKQVALKQSKTVVNTPDASPRSSVLNKSDFASRMVGNIGSQLSRPATTASQLMAQFKHRKTIVATNQRKDSQMF